MQGSLLDRSGDFTSRHEREPLKLVALSVPLSPTVDLLVGAQPQADLSVQPASMHATQLDEQAFFQVVPTQRRVHRQVEDERRNLVSARAATQPHTQTEINAAWRFIGKKHIALRYSWL